MKRAVSVSTIFLLLLATALDVGAMLELRLGSVNALPGQSYSLDHSLTGGLEHYAGMNAKIRLPDGLTVTGISKGDMLTGNFKLDWRTFSKEGTTRLQSSPIRESRRLPN